MAEYPLKVGKKVIPNYSSPKWTWNLGIFIQAVVTVNPQESSQYDVELQTTHLNDLSFQHCSEEII